MAENGQNGPDAPDGPDGQDGQEGQEGQEVTVTVPGEVSRGGGENTPVVIPDLRSGDGFFGYSEEKSLLQVGWSCPRFFVNC